jgi:hypothetical protein
MRIFMRSVTKLKLKVKYIMEDGGYISNGISEKLKATYEKI